MGAKRWLVAAAAAVVVVGAGGWFALRTGAGDAVVARGVRAVAVGTWRCTASYDGDVGQSTRIGIHPDGRLGSGGTSGALAEIGTWELHGLRVSVETSVRYQGVDLPVRYDYVGDADPPDHVDATDHGTGSTGRFTTRIGLHEAVFTQAVVDRDGDRHQRRYRCTKESSAAPELFRR